MLSWKFGNADAEIYKITGEYAFVKATLNQEVRKIRMLRKKFKTIQIGVDLVNDEYLGFLNFPRKRCGQDFIDGVGDGRIKFSMMSYAQFLPVSDNT